MKNNWKIKEYALICNIILVLFLTGFNSLCNIKRDNAESIYDFNEVNLKITGYWNLTGTPIDIDDSDPTKNWSYTTSTYDWCSGDGTWTDPYIIENVTIDGQRTGSCMTIKNSKSVFFIIRNCTLYHGQLYYGDWGGIKLENVNNGTLINNTCLDTNYGILLTDNCDNNTIKNNIANDNLYGISLWADCVNNNISRNLAKHNRYLGIEIYTRSHNNIIYKNHLENNWEPQDWCGGILVESSNYNEITENTIINNNKNGIYLYSDYCYDSIVHKNNITNNGVGIRMAYNIIRTNITENLIKDNSYGIWITTGHPKDSDIYLNEFIGNNIQAYDNGENNNWDNGAIGNYWGDYNGTDADDDGIGDTPYIIEGDYGQSQDNFPIWYDSPNIRINVPHPSEIFDVISPSYNVRITDPNLDDMWYTLNSEPPKVPFDTNGTIEQDLWDSLSDGPILITFWANDTVGNVNSSSVMIIKDTGGPNIVLNYPISYDVFGTTPPTFNIEVTEYLLNTSWYTIDNGLTNFTFTSNESINENAWNNAPDGLIVINFYANDTLGQWGWASITVYKDTILPQIRIIHPYSGLEIGATAPDFIVEFNEANLVEMWYTINESLTTYTFITNGTINQAAWDALPEGELVLKFYIEDIANNTDFDEVQITKNLTTNGNGDGITEPAIPGYQFNILIPLVWTLLTIILLQLKKKLKKK